MLLPVRSYFFFSGKKKEINQIPSEISFLLAQRFQNDYIWKLGTLGLGNDNDNCVCSAHYPLPHNRQNNTASMTLNQGIIDIPSFSDLKDCRKLGWVTWAWTSTATKSEDFTRVRKFQMTHSQSWKSAPSYQCNDPLIDLSSGLLEGPTKNRDRHKQARRSCRSIHTMSFSIPKSHGSLHIWPCRSSHFSVGKNTTGHSYRDPW